MAAAAAWSRLQGQIVGLKAQQDLWESLENLLGAKRGLCETSWKEKIKGREVSVSGTCWPHILSLSNPLGGISALDNTIGEAKAFPPKILYLLLLMGRRKKPENFSTQSFTVSCIFYCFARLLKWKSDGINPWKIIGCTVQGVEGLFLTFHSFWKRYHFSIFVPEIVDIEIMGNISLINICTRNKLYFHSYLKRYPFSIFVPEKFDMKMYAKMLLLNICPKKILY